MVRTPGVLGLTLWSLVVFLSSSPAWAVKLDFELAGPPLEFIDAVVKQGPVSFNAAADDVLDQETGELPWRGSPLQTQLLVRHKGDAPQKLVLTIREEQLLRFRFDANAKRFCLDHGGDRSRAEPKLDIFRTWMKGVRALPLLSGSESGDWHCGTLDDPGRLVFKQPIRSSRVGVRQGATTLRPSSALREVSLRTAASLDAEPNQRELALQLVFVYTLMLPARTEVPIIITHVHALTDENVICGAVSSAWLTLHGANGAGLPVRKLTVGLPETEVVTCETLIEHAEGVGQESLSPAGYSARTRWSVATARNLSAQDQLKLQCSLTCGPHGKKRTKPGDATVQSRRRPAPIPKGTKT